MTVNVTGVVIQTALWPQGDMRDPLGIWGSRVAATGDVTGGSVKASIEVPASQRAAYIYTCYAATAVALSGSVSAGNIKCRLLTNWPNIDILAGVQGFATFAISAVQGATTWSSPTTGSGQELIRPLDRFLLLFDPRPINAALAILELEFAVNDNTVPYSFEAYGYFWDRSVLNAPGGLRHPGSA